MSDNRMGCRTPYASSLALQTLSYRAMGHPGMDEDKPLGWDEIPVSLKLANCCKECGRLCHGDGRDIMRIDGVCYFCWKSIDRDIEPGDCYGRD